MSQHLSIVTTNPLAIPWAEGLAKTVREKFNLSTVLESWDDLSLSGKFYIFAEDMVPFLLNDLGESSFSKLQQLLLSCQGLPS